MLGVEDTQGMKQTLWCSQSLENSLRLPRKPGKGGTQRAVSAVRGDRQLLGALGKLAKHKLMQMPGGSVHSLILNLGRETCSHPHMAEPRRKNNLSQGLQGNCCGTLPRSSIPLLPPPNCSCRSPARGTQ